MKSATSSHFFKKNQRDSNKDDKLSALKQFASEQLSKDLNLLRNIWI